MYTESAFNIQTASVSTIFSTTSLVLIPEKIIYFLTFLARSTLSTHSSIYKESKKKKHFGKVLIKEAPRFRISSTENSYFYEISTDVSSLYIET